MGKVILTKEQIAAIENLKDGGWDDEHIIKIHKIPGEWNGIWGCLNGLSVVELHRVLQYGYQTKEDYIQELEKNADKCEHDTDNVNKPSHYHTGNIDVIKFSEENFSNEELKGFCRINAIKYITRYDKKNGIEDLDKAIFYINKLKELESNE